MTVQSICAECGRNNIWGGTSGFLPHTDEFHEQVRRRLLYAVKLMMTGRLAVKDGHEITIRFTQVCSWTECSCGWSSYRWPFSGQARHQGLTHLWEIGWGLLDKT